MLQKEYSKYTPLILLINFITLYSVFNKKSKTEKNDGNFDLIKKFEESLPLKISEYSKDNYSEDLVKVYKNLKKN